MNPPRNPCRGKIEAAFRTPDIPSLSNNEIAGLLKVCVESVRTVRRHLESSGEIPIMNCRLGRHGNLIDVSRVSEPTWRKAVGQMRGRSKGRNRL